MDTDPELADDLLVGAAAISEYVFGTPDDRRKVYRLAESGELPIFKLGATLCARKSRLNERISRKENKT